MSRVWRVVALGLLLAGISLAQGAPPISGRFAPELSDEFSGDRIDPSIWMVAHPYYPGRPPGRIDLERVTVRDGMVWLETREGAGYYLTPFLRAKTEIRYGYFEIRARLARCRVNQAFWFYAWRERGTREIDVFEMAPGAPGEARQLHTNLHVYDGDPALENDSNRRSAPQKWSAPDFDPTEFNVYGFLWTPERLEWRVNGQVIREAANRDFHWPMALTFTGEIHPKWFGLPAPGELPCAMAIDYVRVWRLADEPSGEAVDRALQSAATPERGQP